MHLIKPLFAILLLLLIGSNPAAAAEPTVGPSNLQVKPIDCSSVVISLAPGNGSGRIVVVSQNAGYTETQPVDGVSYASDRIYRRGSQTNSKQVTYVVGSGQITEFTVYGLAPGTTYTVSSYEYTQTDTKGGGYYEYESTHPETGQTTFTTGFCSAAEPERPATAATVTKNVCSVVTISWTPGSSADGRLVVMGEYNPTAYLMPTHGVEYTARARYPTGAAVGRGVAVYQGTGSSVTIQEIPQGVSYSVEIYEYRLDANGKPVYLLSKDPARLTFKPANCNSLQPPTVLPTSLGTEIIGGYSYQSLLDEGLDAETAEMYRPFLYNMNYFNVTWQKGNGTHWVAFLRDTHVAPQAIQTPKDGTIYNYQADPSQYGTNYISQRGFVADGNYAVGGGAYVDGQNFTVGSLFGDPNTNPNMEGNPKIGHVYELAIYEYFLDANKQPVYQTNTSARNTFIIPRPAPVITAKTNSNNKAVLTCTIDTEYLTNGYSVLRSDDGGATYYRTSMTAPGRAASSSARTFTLEDPQRVSSTKTTYKVVMEVVGINDVMNLESNAASVPGVPLPVELVHFTGKVVRGHAQLSWATAMERNSKYFSVERSTDGYTFAAIAQVAAAGTSSVERTYAYLDPQPVAGKTYYRLRQVDLDSTQAYSPVVSLVVTTEAAPTVSVYPNPAAGGALTSHIQLAGLSNRNLVLVVIDNTGRILAEKKVSASSNATLDLPLDEVRADLQPGYYVLRVQDEQAKQVWNTRFAVNQ